MSKTVEIKINQFYGGISDSPRKPGVAEFIKSANFDIFTDPYSLIPYRSLEADTETSVSATDLKQYFVRDFLYASTSAKLYGLGQTGAGLTKILQKDNAVSGLWSKPASSEGNGAVKNGCFVEFKDYIWGFQGTNQLWKWGLLSGSPSITNSVATVGSTITSVAQGIIASDANLYLPYNNKLVRIAPGLTVTDAVISVPDNFKITSLANYGNYLAIGCSPTSSFNGVSKVFIWNLSSDLFTETINFGEGDLRIIEVIEGMLVGITDRYLNNSTGAGTGSFVIQTYGGGAPQVIKEIFTKALTGQVIPLSKAVKNNRLFFAAKIFTNSAGTTYDEGIWSFGRKNAGYNYSLSLDIVDENVTTDGIQAFGLAGNFFFLATNNDGSVTKTNDSSVYTFSSIYESQIYDFGDIDNDKRLESVKVSCRKLASGETITVKIKWDDAANWTTVGSMSTSGILSHTFVNIESTGAEFASGRECRLRLESTGGAEILGYKLKATILDNI